MRNKIIIAFVLIFSLFLFGSGITVFNLVSTSSKLEYLIGMHEIEDIRQELFSSILKVSSYVYSSPDTFSDHLDEIILNANIMHNAIRSCNDCHHEPGVQNELDENQRQVDDFEQHLSFLITLVSSAERRYTLQEEVYQKSTEILNRVQAMVNMAALSIDKKTIEATNELNRVYFLVGATMFCTVIAAFFIAHYLTKSITGPIDALVNSTRKIADGQWGHQTTIQTTGEFKELVSSFNHMSESLARQGEKEKLHIKELRDTQKQLIEAEKLTALGTMAGGIAHDFNNILCGMIGHLNILGKQIPANEEQRKTIETIEKAGFRAAELVKQLLTFARQKPMKLEPVSLNNCLKDGIQLIEKTINKMIRIEVDLSPTLPSVMGDPTQLEQVIINLCLNARDAMPEGGSISLKTAIIEAENNLCATFPDATPQRYVLLTVMDTGTGINEKILPRIFDPFFTTKEVGKGTGLGLAIVYGIVKNHDGFCTIESTPGKGTNIKVYIPAIEEKEAELKPVTQRDIPANKTILLVDDEPLVIRILKDHLEELGCKTLSAENGQEAIDILREKKNGVDLVILDINMPVMSGIDAYHEFRKIKPDIQVLVTSGYIINEEMPEVFSMGAQGFLQKPFRMAEVNEKILEVLSCQEASS